jgi:hypothetical protein
VIVQKATPTVDPARAQVTRESLVAHLLAAEMVAAGLIERDIDTLTVDDLGGKFLIEIKVHEITEPESGGSENA